MNTPNIPGKATFIPPDETQLVFDRLNEVSQQCWGTEQYGVTARSYVEKLWQAARFSIYIDDSIKDVSINSELPAEEVDLFDSLRGRGLGRDKQYLIGEAFGGVLDAAPLPFYFNVKETGEGYALFRAYPSSLSRHKLATYMEDRKLSHHRLTGTAGKSLDTLNMAAGISGKTVVDSIDPLDYIELPTLLKDAEVYGLSQSQMHKLKLKLSQSVLRQMRTGLPLAWGEVVIEGPFSAMHPLDSIESCSVAVASLAVVARDFERSKIKYFLNEVAA